MGNPWVWKAESDAIDYHENMNATMFESYMVALCKWCEEEYPGRKIVFCMDNAKYHRREFQGGSASEAAIGDKSVEAVDEYLKRKADARKTEAKAKGKDKGKSKDKEKDPPQKSLSQLTKGELIQRLAPLLAVQFAPLREEVFASQMKNYTKLKLYDLARKPEFALPLTTEVISRKYDIFRRHGPPPNFKLANLFPLILGMDMMCFGCLHII